MKIIMGFPSLIVLTSRHVFLKRYILAELSSSSGNLRKSMTKQISPDGDSGCSSLISDGGKGGLGSSFSSAMGLLHDPVFCPWMLTFVLELQCSCSSLRKGIIVCKWYGVARDPDCIEACSKDVCRG